MKLVVGLGNPGDAYSRTRHNLGFLTVDLLAAGLPVPTSWDEKRSDPAYQVAPFGKDRDGEFWLLMKPGTFMNESGRAVRDYVKNAKVQLGDIWVVHDDVDLPEGELREAYGSGSAGHRGVESIIGSLGTKDFHRLRIGVGRPSHPEQPVEDFVLEKTDAKLLDLLARPAADILTRKFQEQ